MSDANDDALAESLAGPLKVQGDAGSVEQHKLTDQIAAIKYLKGQGAASKARRGARFTQLIPPGTYRD